MVGPYLRALQRAEGLEASRQPVAGDHRALLGADEFLHACQCAFERRRDVLTRRREGVLGDEQAFRAHGARRFFEQHLADARQHAGIAREPAESIETRRQRHAAFQRDAAMAWAKTIKAAKRSRQAYRAAAIGADGKIDQPRRRRRGRAARRAAGNTAGCVDVYGRAVMGVLTHQAVGQFIRVGFAGEIGAGIQQALQGRRCRLGGRMGGQPIRVATARYVPGHIEHVLGAKIEAGERPRRRALEGDVGLPAKGANFIFHARAPITLNRLAPRFPVSDVNSRDDDDGDAEPRPAIGKIAPNEIAQQGRADKLAVIEGREH